jgi:hypothetical protein
VFLAFGMLLFGSDRLVILPWTWRSLVYSGSLLPTRTGENLFVSTSAYPIGVVRRCAADLLIQFAAARHEANVPASSGARKEGTTDRLLVREALAFVLAHPGQAALLKLQNAA